MTKKKAASAKKTSKRAKKKTVAAKTTRAEALARRKKEAVRGTIEDWMARVRESHAAAEAAAKPKGACLVGDPSGGPSMCMFVDRDTCKLMKGTFVGGPC